MKFLFANVPLSVVHFVLLLLSRSNWPKLDGILGQPGYWLNGVLGAANGGVLFWIIMALNSLLWGAVISVIIMPLLRKLFK